MAEIYHGEFTGDAGLKPTYARVPVQVSGDGNHPIVLCNDGTIWYLHYTHNRGNVVEPFTMAWKQFPSIPQP